MYHTIDDNISDRNLITGCSERAVGEVNCVIAGDKLSVETYNFKRSGALECFTVSGVGSSSDSMLTKG